MIRHQFHQRIPSKVSASVLSDGESSTEGESSIEASPAKKRSMFSPQSIWREQKENVPLGNTHCRTKQSPARKTPLKTPKRTGNEQCCLTAEINRELFDNRGYSREASAIKTPTKTPKTRKSMAASSPAATNNSGAIERAPLTDTKLFKSKNATQIEEMSLEVSNFATPAPKPRKKNPSLTFSALSAKKKLKKCLTPPRVQFGSHMKEKVPPNMSIESNSSYPGVDEFRITSSELEPSAFQVELPSKNEFVVHSKICSLVDDYTTIHRDFNFAILAGVTRHTLENEYKKSTPDNPMIAGFTHRDVVAKILDCCDDLIVEGFFREYGEDTQHKDSRLEACIFSSEKLRQIIVCFRGSTANQAKPLRTNFFGKEATSLLHQEQKVQTLSAFRDAYFGTGMEDTVFALLDNLATRKPFFDVVMTGHSFGAAMATIGATRYSLSHPMIRVSCHLFGAPKIGGEEWRQLVHSIPNLKIFRAENGADPFVMLPSGSEWIHVGHSISFCSSSDGKVEFCSRQFDRDRSASSHLFRYYPKVNLPVNTLIPMQGKLDHEINSYVEKLLRSGDNWFSDFSGMEGNGVSGTDNERRIIA